MTEWLDTQGRRYLCSIVNEKDIVKSIYDKPQKPSDGGKPLNAFRVSGQVFLSYVNVK